MPSILKKFKVENFRSIVDSGWITTENVTCLVGTNESGKTNILLALWKLNPANSEPINPLLDYPRKKYHKYSNTNGFEIFITAEFELSAELINKLSTLSGWHKDIVKNIIVSRKYNGKYEVQYSNNKLSSVSSNEIISHLNTFITKYLNSDVKEKESDEINENIEMYLKSLVKSINSNLTFSNIDVKEIKEKIRLFIETNYKRKININSFFDQHLYPNFDKIINAFNDNSITVTEECKKIILQSLPTFVYYSDYGNLDSEIYLPHVIDNFDREDLGDKERAKVRSLKVLFEFVNLSPEEILELGKEALQIKVITKDRYGNVESEEIEDPEEQNIADESEKKKKREILLQSASSTLTDDFKTWWKQGSYKFRFQADGNHFRIWVSDEKRTEEIELEGRSRGLQWFFSFFLVFLVESKDAHSNCILLLDEPGISLHPIAQIDLLNFFNSLSRENQLLYTTHSPFLVNANNLSGVYAMYVGESGESVISSDLRANRKIAEKSIYPIHAAIGITVSDILLIGCQPVLVEGVSDQIYLQLIKKFALSQGEYRNDKELVFIPTGGVSGMSPVIKILMGRENDLPYVLLDSDKPGQDKIKQLQNNLYKEEKNKVLNIGMFLGDGEFEVEDILPKEELARIFSKLYRRTRSEDEFDYILNKTEPIVNQMEEFASDNGYTLEDGWKVELAKEFQRNYGKIIERLDLDLKAKWLALIKKLTE